jgi:hypothetical protein
MLDDDTLGRLSDLLKDMRAEELATPVRLACEATLLLREAGVRWEEISLVLRVGWENYRAGGRRTLDWVFDPGAWEPLPPTPDGLRGFRYHDSGGPPVAQIQECHLVRGDLSSGDVLGCDGERSPGGAPCEWSPLHPRPGCGGGDHSPAHLLVAHRGRRGAVGVSWLDAR